MKVKIEQILNGKTGRKVDLEKISNGLLMTTKTYDGQVQKCAFISENDESIDAFCDLIFALEEHFSIPGDKYSPQVLKLITVPGHKYEGELQSDQIDKLVEEIQDLMSRLDCVFDHSESNYTKNSFNLTKEQVKKLLRFYNRLTRTK